MKKLSILLLVLALFTGCVSPKTYYVPDHKIKGDDTAKVYTLKLTEKGVRRVTFAIEAYQKGTEYSKGYRFETLLITTISALVIGAGAGYFGGSK